MKYLNKILLLCLVFCICLLICSNVCAESGNDQNNNTNLNNLNECGLSLNVVNDNGNEFNVSNYVELSNIVNSNNDVVVNLNGNLVVEFTIDVNSNKNVTINGNGCTIDGNNLRFMNIGTGSTVVLNNLIIQNCRVQGSSKTDDVHLYGGSIINKGVLFINNCTFNHNGVDSGESAYGGVIYNDNGYLKINNTLFENNYVLSYTSSFKNNEAYGGAIYNNNGNVEIDSCIFKANTVNKNHNKGQYGGAGAIYNYAKMKKMNRNNGNIIISNSKFIENGVEGKVQSDSIDGWGGAICNEGFLEIIDCDFLSNKVSVYSRTGNDNSYGGAIHTCVDSVTLIEGKCIFKDNFATDYGGAIHNNGETIINCIELEMINNKAKMGLTLYSSKNSILVNNNKCTVINDNVYFNSTNDDNTFNVNISNINEINNFLSNNQYNIFIFNLTSDCYIPNTIFINFVDKKLIINGNGHIIYGNNNRFLNINAGNVFLNNLTIKNFKLTLDKKNMYNDIDGGVIVNKGELSISDCIFDNNGIFSYGNNKGGVIYNLGTLNIINSIFTNNYINSDIKSTAMLISDPNKRCVGGGVIYNKGDVIISNSTFNNNYINKLGYVAYGGVIDNDGVMDIFNSKFMNNNIKSSKGFGGAIHNGNKLNIINCDFMDNVVYIIRDGVFGIVSSNGGAISNYGKVLISGSCSFINNVVDNFGGAIFNGGAGNIVINCNEIKMINNKARNNDQSSNLYSENNKISFNGFDYLTLGGDINIQINESNVNITVANANNFEDLKNYINVYDNVIINLFGDEYFVTDTIYVNPQKNITINGNGVVIDGNGHRFMDINGGTVYLNNLTLINCKVSKHSKFVWNKITINGGAIVNNGELNIYNCCFKNNGLDSDENANGGVIFNSGNLTMIGSSFVDNYVLTATSSGNNNHGRGGAVYNDVTGSVEIMFCNFTGNTINKNHNKGQYGYGGAVYNNGNMSIYFSEFDFNGIEGKVQAERIEGFGGAIYNNNKLNIRSSTFIGNSVSVKSNTGKSYSSGGAIFTDDKGLTIVDGNCSFIKNSAKDYGGALFSNGKNVIDYDTIVMWDNYAANGKSFYGGNNGILLNGVNYFVFDDDINKTSEGIAKFYLNVSNVTVFVRIVDCTFLNGTTIDGVNFMKNLIMRMGGNVSNIGTFNFETLLLEKAIKDKWNDSDFGNFTQYVIETYNGLYGDNIKSFTFLAYSKYASTLNYYGVINSAEELINFANKYNSNPNNWDSLTLNIVNGNYSIGSSLFNFKDSLTSISIIGNDSLIKISNPNDRAEFHFISVNNKQIVNLEGLIISGFNTAVINHGLTFVYNCTFVNNRMDYKVEADYGGAIKNFNVLICMDSFFIDNYAKYGGAIYNKGGVCLIYNCTFENNNGYGKGKDIYNFGDVVFKVAFTDCQFDNGKPLSEGLKAFITVLGGGLLAVATVVCPPVGGPLSTFFVSVVVGAVAGTAIGAITGLIFAVYDHDEHRGATVKFHTIKGLISGVIVGAISGVAKAIKVYYKNRNIIETESSISGDSETIPDHLNDGMYDGIINQNSLENTDIMKNIGNNEYVIKDFGNFVDDNQIRNAISYAMESQNPDTIYMDPTDPMAINDGIKEIFTNMGESINLDNIFDNKVVLSIVEKGSKYQLNVYVQGNLVEAFQQSTNLVYYEESIITALQEGMSAFDDIFAESFISRINVIIKWL